MKKLVAILIVSIVLLFSTVQTFTISNLKCEYKADKNRYVCAILSPTIPVMKCTRVAVDLNFNVLYKCVIKDGAAS